MFLPELIVLLRARIMLLNMFLYKVNAFLSFELEFIDVLTYIYVFNIILNHII